MVSNAGMQYKIKALQIDISIISMPQTANNY